MKQSDLIEIATDFILATFGIAAGLTPLAMTEKE